VLPARKDATMKELQRVAASAFSVTTTLINKPTPYNNTELTDFLSVHNKKVNVKHLI